MTSAVATMDIEDAAGVFTDPKAYADNDRFYAATALLRRESPVHRVERRGFAPFFAITKHQDVWDIARDSQTWINASITWQASVANAISSPMWPATIRCT